MTHLVLLGAGHAHLAVLRHFALLARERGAKELPARLTLVSPVANPIYSGMLPGWIAGHYTLAQCCIPLHPLAGAAGADFRLTRAAALDIAARHVRLADDCELPYDVLSIDIGSAPDLASIDGAQTVGVPVRPLERFVRRWQDFLATVPVCREVAVAGAGAAGVELACALRAALDRRGETSWQVRLFTGNGEPLAERSSGLARQVAQALRVRRIHVIRERITAVSQQHVTTAGGQRYASAFTVLATGAAAPALLQGSGLALDAQGFARVAPTLRALDHPEVFLAGDCATLDAHPLPRSGVYAVRQGPVLAHNLAALLAGTPLRPFVPQRYTLSLISTGARHAIAGWGPLVWQGRWVWWWKNRIDQRFVARARHPA